MLLSTVNSKLDSNDAGIGYSKRNSSVDVTDFPLCKNSLASPIDLPELMSYDEKYISNSRRVRGLKKPQSATVRGW